MNAHAPSTERGEPCGVKALPLERAAQAYPLVQSVLPGTSLQEWLDYAATLILGGAGAAAGILAAEHGTGCLAGLCAYRARVDLAHGRVLTVEQFIVLSLFDERRIAATLAAEVEATAQRLGCAAVHTLLPAGSEAALRALEDRGHRMEIRLYRKAIAAAAR